MDLASVLSRHTEQDPAQGQDSGWHAGGVINNRWRSFHASVLIAVTGEEDTSARGWRCEFLCWGNDPSLGCHCSQLGRNPSLN